jgi:hypothetical protein
MLFFMIPVFVSAAESDPATEAGTIQGAEGAYTSNVMVKNTDRPWDFKTEIYGFNMAIGIPNLPAGPLTLELDLSENYWHGPNQRVMAILADGRVITRQLDIFKEAGGFGMALTKSFPIQHDGTNVLYIDFTAIQDTAKFSGIRITDADGNVLARISAADRSSFQVDQAQADERSRLRLLDETNLVFFNADHSPVGAYAGLLYGMKGRFGGFERGPRIIPSDGLLVAQTSPDGAHLEVMPFFPSRLVSTNAQSIPENEVRRTIRACTDRWTVPGLSWIHYCPSWYLADIDTASVEEKKRFTLPATWMVFTVDNTGGKTAKDFYFGLPDEAQQKQFAGGRFEGFSTGMHAMAVAAGSCDLLTGTNRTDRLGNFWKGFAFHLKVPPGQRKELKVIVAHYEGGVVSPSTQGCMYYTTLFKSADDVVAAASAEFNDARARCEQLDSLLEKSGQNDYRKFLAGHALHSYRLNTFLLMDGQGKAAWSEVEGEYNNNNTFDLTVDHLFYDLAMHPWVTRNVLDRMASDYTFEFGLVEQYTTNWATGGFSFHHDMGNAGDDFRFEKIDVATAYEQIMAFMGQEELQNWILCAGLYWKKTGDTAWL